VHYMCEPMAMSNTDFHYDPLYQLSIHLRGHTQEVLECLLVQPLAGHTGQTDVVVQSWPYPDMASTSLCLRFLFLLIQ